MLELPRLIAHCQGRAVRCQHRLPAPPKPPCAACRPPPRSLTVPELRRPGGEVALPQCSFRAVGRGRTDAEQQCARQALERATKAGLKAV